MKDKLQYQNLTELSEDLYRTTMHERGNCEDCFACIEVDGNLVCKFGLMGVVEGTDYYECNASPKEIVAKVKSMIEIPVQSKSVKKTTDKTTPTKKKEEPALTKNIRDAINKLIKVYTAEINKDTPKKEKRCDGTDSKVSNDKKSTDKTKRSKSKV